MGKLLDFLMSNTYEEFQRIQLYKKVGKKLETPTKKMSKDEDEDIDLSSIDVFGKLKKGFKKLRK